jgi:hypothetical protein
MLLKALRAAVAVLSSIIIGFFVVALVSAANTAKELL